MKEITIQFNPGDTCAVINIDLRSFHIEPIQVRQGVNSVMQRLMHMRNHAAIARDITDHDLQRGATKLLATEGVVAWAESGR